MAKDHVKPTRKKTTAKPRESPVGKWVGNKGKPTTGLGRSTAGKAHERYGNVKEVFRDNKGRQR